MEILTSWDDGNKLDLKMAKLLLKYNIPAIFFLPTIGCQLTIDEIKELSHNFEIGGHTTTHPQDIKRMSDEDAFIDILCNKEWLEDIIKKKIEWFCYPRGRYNERTIQVLKDTGFKKARTTWVGNTDRCDNEFRIHPSVHVAKGRKEYKGQKWLDYAIEQYELAKNKENSVYYIWGHSLEVEQQQLWGELEELFIYIYGNNNNRSNNNTNQA